MRVFSFAMRSPFIRNTVKEQWSSCSFKAFAMRSSFKSGPDLWFEKRVNVVHVMKSKLLSKNTNNGPSHRGGNVQSE